MPDLTSQRHWHLFCRVIDNFGDIGVCWRLARQLLQQHGQQVTLWVDDLSSFRALCPALDCSLAEQQQQGIVIRHWAEDFPQLSPLQTGDVVVEAFACELPQSYIAAMQQREHAACWINLEYLSAEDWVPGFHLSQSPVHGLSKTFFFPGFVSGTGGLLCEPELAQLPQQMAEPAARRTFLSSFGLAPALADCALQISLFAYENPALAGLLDALQTWRQTVHLLVPAGRVSAGLDDWLGETTQAGHTYQRGRLSISVLPFMSQPQYDQLLAMCDLNLVRGEESFVRAQMLGKPMLWHIYRQEEDAHLEKLEAFLGLYCDRNNLSDRVLAEHLAGAFRHWNQAPESALAAGAEAHEHWHGLLQQLPAWQTHAGAWQQQLQALGDLASNLVHYATDRV
ncbi:elongation factor P maturation arginine rhamnosyltransferase EarP [Thalassolituus hydrocarboniclasticus]|uniref:Protein-arginine rhamnosyltransferase n=2 Tax=Thalassolituus hydrocarboniclasticus TaxID=2742796 RepID=A0ABY6AFV8_9GAMM|nr:elongation factor P maturation arginine rhamnosyltransferase EarP [Thalassolituus hydrocarboniclasticus]